MNKPSLDEKELRTIFESAEKNKYVYGCNDELLKSYCQDKTKCPLGVNNVSALEIVEEEIQKLGQVRLHPLLDYHPSVGLTLGYTFLSGDQKLTLYFCRGSLKTFKFNGERIEAKGSNRISFKDLRWTNLSPIHSSIFLLLSRDYCKTGGIKNEAKNKVFENVLRKESYYWWHSDKRWYIAVACWAIGTYYHPIFEFHPALIIQGQREQGNQQGKQDIY